jgi:LuxR family maltose regulon positive regulatory protein
MMGQQTLPEHIEELLKSNDFIRYFPDKSVYTMHSILQDYLQNRFYHHKPPEYQQRIFRQAGNAFAALSQYYPAAQFFLKVGNFDAILSLPFTGEYLDNQKENLMPEFIARLWTNARKRHCATIRSCC